MPLALLALAIGAFGIGTTEFVIMGVCCPRSRTTSASSSRPPAGSSPATPSASSSARRCSPRWARKVSRKKMLMFLMGLFIVGNTLSAVAPTFGLMLIGRVVASPAHGAFFGIDSVVAADLVAPTRGPPRYP
ncbi:Inner membrane transport protein YdhP [Streptomyces sp. SudanB25_2051]